MKSNHATILKKIYRYCAWQERCATDVRLRLIQLECPRNQVEEIVDQLQEEGFLDDKRFAGAYVRGKFRMKQWGRMKIRSGLKAKKIPDAIIEDAIREQVDEKEYLQTIQKLADDKWQKVQEDDLSVKKQKVIRYLLQRGYEGELVFGLAIKEV